MRIFLVLILLVAGCSTPLPPKIQTKTVEIKVYDRPTPPKDLVSCPTLGRLPIFLPYPGSPDWVALDPEGQRLLKGLLLAPWPCIDAWRIWSMKKAPD